MAPPIVPPTLLSSGLEYSIHGLMLVVSHRHPFHSRSTECPPRNEDDVRLVFPQLTSLTGAHWCVCRVFSNTSPHTGMLIVPTTQRADMDLVGIGATVEQEKDALLEKVHTRCCVWAVSISTQHSLWCLHVPRIKHLQRKDTGQTT